MTKQKFLAVFVCPLVVAAAILQGACSDPAVVKRRHLDKANDLAAKGKYNEAILEYKNALKADSRFGEARFQLAEAYVHNGNPNLAAKEYLRAAELLPGRADVQTKAAVVLLSTQDFDGARSYAQAALKADPKSVEAHIALAHSLAGLKDPDGAMKQLERAIQESPGDPRGYTSLGTMNSKLGNAKDAEAAFKKAVELDPKSAEAKSALAHFYWASNRLGETDRVLQDAAATNPDDVLCNRMQALFFMTHGRDADAEAPLQRLVKSGDTIGKVSLVELYIRTKRAALARPLLEDLKGAKATRVSALGRLASIDYEEGKHQEAYQAIENALKEQPKATELLMLKTDWLLRERRLNEALEAANATVTSAPESASAQYTLGNVQAARADRDAATKAYTEALRLDPAMKAANLQMSRLRLEAGDTAGAFKYAEAARRAQPSDPDSRLAVATALVARGDLANAEREIKALQQEYPNAPAVQSLYGKVLLARKDTAGAARAFDHALELNPADLEALRGRIIVALDRKQPYDARAAVDKALNAAPKDARVLVTAARYEQAINDLPSAEKHLRRAIEVEPAALDAYQLLGRLYFDQKRLEEAKKEFEQLVRRTPDDVAARTMIGMILDAQDRPDEAQKMYQGVISASPGASVAANNLAWMYVERGEKLEVALSLAQVAKGQMPDRPEVNDTLGWVYYKMNMSQLAIAPLELCVAKDPRNAVYHYHLGLAYAKLGETAKARATLQNALKLDPNFDGASEARATLANLKG